ncbi:MAG: hypothetical protein ACOZAN_01505 [Patescibacteria group bacterium]
MVEIVSKVYAACNPGSAGINLADCLELSDGTTVASQYSDLSKLVNLAVSNMFVIAGFILFVLIIISGFKFLKDESKGKDEAKTIMTTATIGLIIMFAAYWIVQVVELITKVKVIG